MKQMTYDEIRDVMIAKGYSDYDAQEFIWDWIKFTKVSYGNSRMFWICSLAFDSADLNEDHANNDCYWFCYGSKDASRNIWDAFDFLLITKFENDRDALFDYLVDEFNQEFPNEDWQTILEDC